MVVGIKNIVIAITSLSDNTKQKYYDNIGNIL